MPIPLNQAFFESDVKSLDRCFLCPRRCGADRTKENIGYCRSGNTARVARIAPHYWEEPIICRNGSGAVFFTGCNLRCVYCQNSLISRDGRLGREFTPEELADEYIRLQDTGVCNINLVTPTHWTESVIGSLDIAWNKGLYLPVVYNCGGYESVETLKRLRGYISVYLPDFKYVSADVAARYSNAPDYPQVALDALREMAEQRGEASFSDGLMTKGVIVRHMVLPGLAEESKKAIETVYSEFGDSVYISIMNQYTPMDGCPPELSRKVTEKEYGEVVDYAVGLGVKNAFIQEGEAASESFIPLWDLL